MDPETCVRMKSRTNTRQSQKKSKECRVLVGDIMRRRPLLASDRDTSREILRERQRDRHRMELRWRPSGPTEGLWTVFINIIFIQEAIWMSLMLAIFPAALPVWCGPNGSSRVPRGAAHWQQWAADSRAAERPDLSGQFGFASARLQNPRGASWSAGARVEREQQQAGLEHSSGAQRIRSLHEQLNALKSRLEAELAREVASRDNSAGPAGAATLGSPCLDSSHCSRSIRNAHCATQTFTCSCLPEHVRLNESTCLAPALLGFECQIDAQCRQRVPASVCQSARCACPADEFVPYKRNKCLSASKINDYCLTDSQCQLNDRHSFCHWKIFRVYGTCKCPPNYKLLPVANASIPGAAHGLSEERQSFPATSDVRCAPRLGDACLSDLECRLTTPNAICSRLHQSEAPPKWAPSTSEHTARSASHAVQLRAGTLGDAGAAGGVGGANSSADSSRWQASSWRTSSASESRCTCAPGFEWSRDQLSCIKVRQSGGRQPPEASNAGLLDDSQRYEMIVIGAPAPAQQATSPSVFESTRIDAFNSSGATTSPGEQLDIKILTTGPSTSNEPPTTNGAQNLPESRSRQPAGANNSSAAITRMSSLGKRCNSGAECQARDPYSDCIGGVCECLMPTSRCRASSTGCHADTFQCRSGQCISWYFVCDKFRNCDDGSDEDDCQPAACPRESFQCRSDGSCITRGKVCNGRNDCADASDERHCHITTPADNEQVNGQGIGASVDNSITVGLGGARTSSDTLATPSRANNSSQSGQGAAGGECRADAFACQDGQCLPAYVFCNAVRDCRDGSDEDERLCERPSARRKWASQVESGSGPGAQMAPLGATSSDRQPVPSAALGAESSDRVESPLVKTDRASLQRLVAALALARRTPESRGRRQRAGQLLSGLVGRRAGRGSRLLEAMAADEAASPRPPDECPRWAFTCANGKCRSSAILCSGVDGCGDNSDEERCEVCQCEKPD